MNIVGKRLSRAEFADYVKSFDFGSIPPSFLVLHHTWSPKTDQWRGQRSIDGLKAYYEGKGWFAGPHFFVAPDGIWLFTSMYEVGVASNAANANPEFQKTWKGRDLKWYSLALEMVGDFDHERPSGELWENVKAVIGSLAMQLKWNVEKDVHFHREYNPGKSCPGNAVTMDWVRHELVSWVQAHQSIVLEKFVVDSPIGTNIHQGPALNFPVAGSMADDAPFEGKVIVGEPFEGSNEWVWVSTGLGFVPRSRVKRPSEDGLTVKSPPRIGMEKFASVLRHFNSPALPFYSTLYRTCVSMGVDPAVALAFFVHESNCGTKGLAVQNLSWGNVRTPEDPKLGTVVQVPGRGGFARYQNWNDGLVDWCKRLLGPKYAGSGLVTVEQVIPKYAPSSDNNSPTGYSAAVKLMVAGWQE